MNLLRPLLRKSESRYTLTDYAQTVGQMFGYGSFGYQGTQYPYGVTFSQPGAKIQPIGENFQQYVTQGLRGNGVVATLELIRVQVFSQARYKFRRFVNGRPGPFFGTPALAPIETPSGGTNSGLLSQMILDADMAGSSYGTLVDGKVFQLRPDWVDTVVAPVATDAGRVGYETLGYLFWQDGERGGGARPTPLLPEEVAHFCAMRDPLAPWRGMSWLTPVLRDVMGDRAYTNHKLTYMANAATPNLAVKLDAALTPEQFDFFVEKMDKAHKGPANAGKTLYLGGGADVTVVGANMAELDFKVVQGAGEPLALDTPVPTPSGWTTMGEIQPGDRVFGRDGVPARVLDVSPVHHGRPCYRVTFNDRTSVVADESHLWTAVDRQRTRTVERTYTTGELRVLIAEWSDRVAARRIGILPPAPVKLEAKDLLVDPYVLGVWLGDGATAGAAICGATDDLAFIEAEIERRGYTTTHWAPQPDKVAVIGIPGGLLHALDALGVLGAKRIPDEYLRSSHEQRLDLLRGLMDTDGTVGHVGKETCEFSSKWEALARQVAELARSLGIRATLTRKADKRSRTGETWRVSFRADPECVPFLLPRKVARCLTPLHVRNRVVVSIEPVDSVPVRCITVDTADHLFLAGDGWVPTHNTRLAAASGVGAVIAQFSEGMQGSSLNAGNYAASRRRFADITMRHLWQEGAAALSTLLDVPRGSELWADDRDVSFLQEDATDAADIFHKKAGIVANLVKEGFTDASAVAATDALDITLLEHSGLISVQLQDPTKQPKEPSTEDEQ